MEKYNDYSRPEELGARAGKDVIDIKLGPAIVGVINRDEESEDDYILSIKGEIVGNWILRNGSFQVIALKKENGIAFLYLNGSAGCFKPWLDSEDIDCIRDFFEEEDASEEQIKDAFKVLGDSKILSYDETIEN